MQWDVLRQDMKRGRRSQVPEGGSADMVSIQGQVTQAKGAHRDSDGRQARLEVLLDVILYGEDDC